MGAPTLFQCEKGFYNIDDANKQYCLLSLLWKFGLTDGGVDGVEMYRKQEGDLAGHREMFVVVWYVRAE